MAKTALLGLVLMGLVGCTGPEAPAEDTREEATPGTDETFPDGATPLFVVAGQSNAEGNVRLSGIEALQAALPSHSEPLSSTERAAAREAYRAGVGDWCNPAEDYSDEAADAAIDALRDSQLDISAVSADYTIDGAFMAAYRWRFQEASQALSEPYQNPAADAVPAHTTAIAPLGVGFGVWDDEELDVLFYGPELGFGLQVEQAGSLPEFGMVKVAMGGSSMYAHWAPDGPLRAELFARTEAVLAQKPDAAVAGLIWFQGFNDQFEAEHQEGYADNLTNLIEAFRSAYGASQPVVVVQSQKTGGLTKIAAAQEAVADAMDNVSLVESSGMSECFHYDATSQLVIGQRSGAAMLTLLGQ
jgi:hypothetical protein